MTTSTETQVVAPSLDGAARLSIGRALAAFAAGVLLVALLAGGAAVAYEQAYAGKIVAGVSVGGVDLTGLTRNEAGTRLTQAFAAVGQGTLTLDAASHPTTIGYGELGRRPDVEAMLDQAFAVGRTGTPVEQVVDEVRTALGRVDLPALVTVDRSVLQARLAATAADLDRPAINATIVAGSADFSATRAATGQAVDQAAMTTAILAQLSATDAPAQLAMPLAIVPLAPSVSDVDALFARVRALQMAHDVILADGTDTWTMPAAAVRSWISFGPGSDGSYGPLVNTARVTTALKRVAAKVNRKPVSATFLVGKNEAVVGVKAGRDGRTLGIPATVQAVEDLLVARAVRNIDPATTVTPALTIQPPSLTTAEATLAAPLMQPISSWTTYYFPGPHNGFSANISIPAMAIDGTVVAPGEQFSFWKAVGEVSLAKGYTLGGAIIDGRSVEGKTIGGGICSTSTTIFNAALRAGLEMGDRANHYYYIDRYPKGLDATVFINDSGQAQDMTFRNDTAYPILIRAFAQPGIVRFTLYSVPVGRTVSFTSPIVKNYLPSHTETQPTTTLSPGVRQQVEYAADGQDVWVTRTVRDATGAIIHQETYYSHYARVIGLILVGQAPSTSPSPSPSPTP